MPSIDTFCRLYASRTVERRGGRKSIPSLRFPNYSKRSSDKRDNSSEVGQEGDNFSVFRRFCVIFPKFQKLLLIYTHTACLRNPYSFCRSPASIQRACLPLTTPSIPPPPPPGPRPLPAAPHRSPPPHPFWSFQGFCQPPLFCSRCRLRRGGERRGGEGCRGWRGRASEVCRGTHNHPTTQNEEKLRKSEMYQDFGRFRQYR